MQAPIVPLPILNGQSPVLLIFDQTDPAIELAYEREPLLGGNRVRSVRRDTTDYWIPRLTPVFAANDGVVIYARHQADGHAILIDHGNDWISSYARLAHMFVTPTEHARFDKHVRAGDILGYLGTPRGTPLVPLRFELWRRDDSDHYLPVDPILFLRRWRHIDWRDAVLARIANDAAAIAPTAPMAAPDKEMEGEADTTHKVTP